MENVTSNLKSRPTPPANPNIAIYSGGDPTSSEITTLFNAISAASYSTVILWAAHVDSQGDIAMNDDPIVSGGQFNSQAQPWAKMVTALKQKGTRIELSLGGDQTSFAYIKQLFQQYGNTSKNPLYGNLQTLQSVLGLDALNYDDETEFDPNSSTQLAMMASGFGMRVAMCAGVGEDINYWVQLITAINQQSPGTADAVYLMAYSGGDPEEWNEGLKSTNLTVAPGLWATHLEGQPPNQTCTTSTTAAQAQQQIAAWAGETSLAGGFMFCGTDMLNCPGGGTPADYATALRNGLSAGQNAQFARPA